MTQQKKAPRSSKKEKIEKLRQKRRGKSGASSEPGKCGSNEFKAKEEDDEQPRNLTPVDKCIEAFKEDPRPSKIGLVHCFLYNKKDEPLIVVGPDWGFSLIKIALVNLIMGAILSAYVYTGFGKMRKKIGLALLIFENLAFLATVLMNPGIARRSPKVHSKRYLD